MSTATDILGKVGEKVGSEIKEIKDNYATKVSLGNVSSTIDFSPYATVVSLGVVDQKVEDLDFTPYSTKASLASYASGNSAFTNLKAQRAELDELIVKGETTIVNTQTVEVSDNMIEVNIAADGDITTNTGGIAVNRGLEVGSYDQDTNIASTLSMGATTSLGDGDYGLEALITGYKTSPEFAGAEYLTNFVTGGNPEARQFSLLQEHNGGSDKNYSQGPSNIPSWTNYYFAPTGSFESDSGGQYDNIYYKGDYVLDPWVFDAVKFQTSQNTEDGSTFDDMTDATRYWPKYLKKATQGPAVVSPHVTYQIAFKIFEGDQVGSIYYKRMDDAPGASEEYYKPQAAYPPYGIWEWKYYDSTTSTYTTVSNEFLSGTSMEAVGFEDQKTYISSFGSGNPMVPTPSAPQSFADQNFELSSDLHTFSKGTPPVSYYWNKSFTNSALDLEITVLQSTNDGSGDIRFRIGDKNVGSCQWNGDNYLELSDSGYTMNFTWQNMGTHYQLSNVMVDFIAPSNINIDTTASLSEDTDNIYTRYTIETSVGNGKIQSRFRSAWRARDGGSGNTLSLAPATIATYTEAGTVLPDAELVWNQNLDAWSFSKDGNGSKIFYSNVFPTASDLPSASTYHGMFAHVHDTGRGYFAHGGVWKELFDTSAGQTVTGDIEVADGSALKVANSSGIKINNIDLGNYASFEAALTSVVSGP